MPIQSNEVAAAVNGGPQADPPARSGVDERLDLLHAWLRSLYGDEPFTVETASADASFRRYFRVTREAGTWIAMDAPPEKEDTGPYIAIAEMLVSMGVNAPRITARNLRQGFLLLTDLGDRTYLQALNSGHDADELYGAALRALVRMQAGGHAYVHELPPYDKALLAREVDLFPTWFLGTHLDVELSAGEQAVLRDTFNGLIHEALAQPRVFVHRDYHSRNLMVSAIERAGPMPGVLDFQDAVAGPLTYDLVSLLRDCYIAWPQPRVMRWASEYRDAVIAAGLDAGANLEQFVRWFDWMGVQRHLKAIGIFARLWHRDGKPGYLKDIPRTLDYVIAASARYPELARFHAFVTERVRPALDATRVTQS